MVEKFFRNFIAQGATPKNKGDDDVAVAINSSSKLYTRIHIYAMMAWREGDPWRAEESGGKSLPPLLLCVLHGPYAES